MGQISNNFWGSKSEKEKLMAIHGGFNILRKAADGQLIILKSQKLERNSLSSRHHFIFNIAESFWRDADFAISLKNHQWDFYGIYPIRTMMEKVLKMSYFLEQSEPRQDEISEKEIISTFKLTLDLRKDTENVSDILDLYRQLNLALENKYPPIGTISYGKLKVFPPFDQLCDDKDYVLYRYLSGVPHGQLGSLMSLETTKNSEYRRSMLWGNLLCYRMLKLIDKYLDYKTKELSESAIKEARKLIVGN